jgi:DNA-binding Lrp family transcriptional regulator
MEKALILVNLTSRYPSGLPSMLKDIKGVADAEFIYGPYDLYAVAETETKNEMREIVLKIREMDGVQTTLTCNIM